ncbi:MAG: alkaline phosphatase family protein [Bdellovibrionaceae bacterium]|nr:alkaline phosphatase family protein [Bdellovibrionales bacterium]MCB9084054.1 alkaline phosphatase family protein [Pseudobdellovibrionaceae bacterium]
MFRGTFALLLLVLGLQAAASSTVRIDDPVQHFVFASCNRQHNPQPLWKDIIAQRPQFFLWGGDNVYINSSDPDVMKKEYLVLLDNPDYQDLRRQTPIIGTWDDHDYGEDNGGIGFLIKDFSQSQFLDFIGEPAISPRRSQKGIYTAYTMGPPDQLVKVILLDTRFHKTSSFATDADILGEEQWQWLEEQLAGSKAKVHFLVSSFSVLSPRLVGGEQWIDWGKANARLEELIETYQPSGLVILTGDRHFAGMLKKQLPNGITYYELMASGLTHVAKPILRPLLRKIYGKNNVVFERNFGVIRLDWNSGALAMSFEVHTDKSPGSPPWVRNFQMDSSGIWKLSQ